MSTKGLQLLSMREVCSLTSRSRSSLYRDVRAGVFPAPLRIGPHRVAFRALAVLDWIASRPVAGGGHS